MAYHGASEYLVFNHVSSNVCIYDHFFSYHILINMYLRACHFISQSTILKDIIAAQARQDVEGEMMMTRSANFALSGWKGSYWFELYHVYPKNLGMKNYFWVKI